MQKSCWRAAPGSAGTTVPQPWPDNEGGLQTQQRSLNASAQADFYWPDDQRDSLDVACSWKDKHEEREIKCRLKRLPTG